MQASVCRPGHIDKHREVWQALGVLYLYLLVEGPVSVGVVFVRSRRARSATSLVTYYDHVVSSSRTDSQSRLIVTSSSPSRTLSIGLLSPTVITLLRPHACRLPCRRRFTSGPSLSWLKLWILFSRPPASLPTWTLSSLLALVPSRLFFPVLL